MLFFSPRFSSCCQGCQVCCELQPPTLGLEELEGRTVHGVLECRAVPVQGLELFLGHAFLFCSASAEPFCCLVKAPSRQGVVCLQKEVACKSTSSLEACTLQCKQACPVPRSGCVPVPSLWAPFVFLLGQRALSHPLFFPISCCCLLVWASPLDLTVYTSLQGTFYSFELPTIWQ